MAGFGQVIYNDTVNSLTQVAKDRFNNPYYMFSDKSPTLVTYYRINREKTTLDESAKIPYTNLGTQSPIKFTKINKMLLFGLPRFELNYDVGDFGLEAAELSGDGIVLPNTIRPQEGDMFLINGIKEPLLFQVNNATPDTLDNGNNIWKFEFHVEKSNSVAQIEKQVVKVYNFHAEYIGTDFTCFMDEAMEGDVKKLEQLMASLRELFVALFFDEKLQTFVYHHNASMFYDPYMIEFLRDTKIITKDNGTFYYVQHACALDQLFPIEYGYTIFAHLQQQNFSNTITTMATAEAITDINSLFVTRMKTYYKIRYMTKGNPYAARFNTMPADLLDRINSGEAYEKDDTNNWLYNVAIEFYHGRQISDELIDALIENVFEGDMISFYTIPIALYTLRDYINSLMSNSTVTLEGGNEQ
ncbi:hypothetical protein [uncultured Duncaniella sp.]|uniref:hypothetical protein n=1 Tax=uncultured Duncaniella sp. TaxID=2768039 RepID=UPI0026067059|nr:hypothetical protein [uncultured Duncaniella sp.]